MCVREDPLPKLTWAHNLFSIVNKCSPATMTSFSTWVPVSWRASLYMFCIVLDVCMIFGGCEARVSLHGVYVNVCYSTEDQVCPFGPSKM